MDFTIRTISSEEHKSNLRAEINKEGLYKAIKKRCDEINEERKYMRYVQHRFIQEQLAEILELVEMR